MVLLVILVGVSLGSSDIVVLVLRNLVVGNVCVSSFVMVVSVLCLKVVCLVRLRVWLCSV